ncbi:MAG: prolipoprotein diacylglyceryl transferase [Clostridia bacterium]|nr:prolipoprotein diacylglyceryl transferase [Clostridia bacterium]
MRKGAVALLAILLAAALAVMPFLCSHCSLRPERATAYYEENARRDAAADDSPEAQLMRMLLGGAAEEAKAMEPSRPSYSNYGLSLACGALLCCGEVFLEWKYRKKGKTLLFPLFAAVSLAVPLGLLGSRIVYCAVNAGFYLHDIQSPEAMLRVWEGGLSLAGTLCFAALGGWIAAKLCRIPAREILDLLAPAFVFFAAWACFSDRLIEAGYGPEDGLPLTVIQGEIRMDTARVTFTLLLILAVLRRDFPRSVFLYGSLMILLESLRRDGHMMWGFVHAEQVFALCMALFALLYFAIKIKRFWLAIGATALMAGIVIALEFALDRSPISDWLLYGVFALVMAGYIALGLVWSRKAEKALS